MANNRFNKQVTPKGYKKGGEVRSMKKDPIADYVRSVKEIRKPKGAKRVRKMGGGMMMMKRPMMKDGGNMKNLPKGLRKDTTTSAYGDAGKGRPVPLFLKTRPGQNPKGKNVPISERAPKLKAKKRKKMMGGGSLKPVDPQTQKGLSKLPTKVRNKMGYMKKGGKVNGK